MTQPFVFRIPVVLLALGTYGAPAALAQEPATTPRTTGLFGSRPEPSALRRSLDVTVSISGAQDDDLSGAQGAPALPFETPIGGRYADLDASLSLVHARPRFGVAARAAGSLRRYPDLGDFVTSSKSAAAALTANVSPHTTVRTSVDASDISSFAFDTFARRLLQDESLVHAGLGDASLNRTTKSYGGIAELTRTLGRRSSLGFTYGVRHSESPILGEPSRNDEQRGGVRFARAAGDDASLRAEYTLRQDTQAPRTQTSPLWSHDVQFGLERQWRHSASHRTVISFAAGPAIFETALQGTDRLRLWRLVGGVDIHHEIGRTWHARVSYRRGGGLRDALALSNTSALDVRGQMGPRVDLILSAGYFDRDIELSERPIRMNTAFGTARLQVALARFIAVYGQYFLDYYDYGAYRPRADLYARRLDRRGLRVGVTVWAPLHR